MLRSRVKAARGRVGLRVRSEPACGALPARLRGPGQLVHTVEDDSAFAGRPGLVESEDIDAGQFLDRCQLLDETLVPGQPYPASADVLVPLAIACAQPPLDCIPPLATMGATGISARASQRRTRLRLLRISELTSGNRFAPAAILLEKESASTRITRAAPRPATTIDPERTSGHAFPGQEGFVGLQPAAAQDKGIGRDLVAGPQDQDIVKHDAGGRDLAHGALTQDQGQRGLRNRGAVQGALGTAFLDDANDGVAYGGQPEECVLPAAQEKQDDKVRAYDRVEQGQHIGADDLP